ncbi:MAG: hypothetical protein P8I27_14230, partial [Pirellulaceae bacterium]|nr:hypothetical protein [Pirellulaceae bacterium]
MISLSFVSVGQSQTVRNWINHSGNNPWYSLDNNWDSGSPPSSTDKASFNLPYSYEVWLTGSQHVGFFEALQG